MAAIIDKQGNVSFFGKLSWGNFLDWLITLCLGSIIGLTTVHLGGVRPDTQVALLPLYLVLIWLHGISLLINSAGSRRLSRVPFWFLPFLVWVFVSVVYVSPVPWLGWQEFIYGLQAFIVLWVLCNNVQTRAHLWVLLLMAGSPLLFAIFNGFYQFYQNPGSMMGAFTDFRLALPEQFLGRATGVFADPYTQAAFLLILLPMILSVAAARRLPIILRVLCLYIALMMAVVVAFTQVLWAGLIVIFMVGVVPWFCYRRLKRRVVVSIIGAGFTATTLALVVWSHPVFEKGFQRALAEGGESGRIVLWQEALAMAADHPIRGVGAGAYSTTFEQSARVSLAKSPESPHNDYLLILSQYGAVGCLLLGFPVLYLVACSCAVWRREPFGIKLAEKGGVMMPPRRFFLTLGLTGILSLALCLGMTFVFYVPALLLSSVLLLSILIKSSFPKQESPGRFWLVRWGYFLLAISGGILFYGFAHDKLQSRSLELRATQELDHLIEMRVHLSGRGELLDAVITRYELALVADPENADAWLGLSAALCQRYFRSPVDFEPHGMRAVSSARRATELSPNYWRGWAQLGVAYAYNAELGEAETALLRALEMAPNSSLAHYYYAAFIGGDVERRDEALGYAEQALKINPDNAAARRLEQKLRIL
jgi:O-antigen ligase